MQTQLSTTVCIRSTSLLSPSLMSMQFSLLCSTRLMSILRSSARTVIYTLHSTASRRQRSWNNSGSAAINHGFKMSLPRRYIRAQSPTLGTPPPLRLERILWRNWIRVWGRDSTMRPSIMWRTWFCRPATVTAKASISCLSIFVRSPNSTVIRTLWYTDSTPTWSCCPSTIFRWARISICFAKHRTSFNRLVAICCRTSRIWWTSRSWRRHL